jgi:hypothetical protein
LKPCALQQRSVAIDPAYIDQILDLIHGASATTTRTGHSPYDPLPTVSAGRLRVEEMRTEYDTLRERSNALLASARESQLPDDYLQLLEGYYTAKLREAQDNLAFWDRPFSEVQAEVRAREFKSTGN